jgi:hypothetical protein
MCEIGQPLEIVDVEPLNLPKPLRREQPEEQPATIEVPVAEPVWNEVELTEKS